MKHPDWTSTMAYKLNGKVCNEYEIASYLAHKNLFLSNQAALEFLRSKAIGNVLFDGSENIEVVSNPF